MFKATLEELAGKCKAYNTLQSRHSRYLAKTAIKAVKCLLRAFPEVEAIKWSQYIPTFNDGDACTFTMDDPSLKFTRDRLKSEANGLSDKDEFGENEWQYHYEIKNHPKATKKLVAAFNDCCKIVDWCEEGLEDEYGNNCELTITSRVVLRVDIEPPC